MSRKTTMLLLFILAIAGLADSLYLTYDHGAFHADPAGYGGGLCGADGGCSISRSSALSEIPLPGAQLGLPVSVLALGFYLVFLVLTALRLRASGAQPPRGKGTADVGHLVRLQFALALLANLYSLVLLVYSLSEGSVCKFCVGLYVINAGLLYVTWRSLGESLGSALKAVGNAILSRSGLVAAAVMVAALVAGYVVYRGTVLAARAEAPVTATVDTTSRPHKGPADAPVHLVEFADFECPHCKLAFQALEEVLAARDDVRVSFLHFPLDEACNPLIDRPFHPRACELATMGECAHAQGRFFEAAPLLFAGLPQDDLRAALQREGIDMQALAACMSDGAALTRVRGDIEAGIKSKIAGTPALFLNGVLIGGAVPKDKLMSLIDQAKQAPSLATPER